MPRIVAPGIRSVRVEPKWALVEYVEDAKGYESYGPILGLFETPEQAAAVGRKRGETTGRWNYEVVSRDELERS